MSCVLSYQKSFFGELTAVLIYDTLSTIHAIAGNDLNNLRIPGVLQRFAVTYFIVALTELVFSYGYKKNSQVQVSFYMLI